MQMMGRERDANGIGPAQLFSWNDCAEPGHQGMRPGAPIRIEASGVPEGNGMFCLIGDHPMSPQVVPAASTTMVCPAGVRTGERIQACNHGLRHPR
jgi:hypothetical protein